MEKVLPFGDGELTTIYRCKKMRINKNISRFLFDRFPYPYTLTDAEKWVAAHLNRYPLLNFAIAVDDLAVGGIECKIGDDVHRKSAIMGYWLGEAYWGRGIVTAAIGLITNYVMDNFDIIRIQATVNDNNPASKRVLEKAGFFKEGILKKSIIKYGEILDEHLYAMVKN